MTDGRLPNRNPILEEQIRESLSLISIPHQRRWVVEVYKEIPTTMVPAAELSATLRDDQVGLVLAERQTMGRGRQGRSWFATEGAFLGTFVVPLAVDIKRISGLSLAVGCVLYDTFTEIGCKVGLKWPNDILSKDDRKLSGVLVELHPAKFGSCVLIGIGINLISAPQEVVDSVSVYALCGESYSVADMCNLIAPRLLVAWEEFQDHGFTPFKQRWETAALHLGEELTARNGDELVRGKGIGIDQFGRLQVETSEGIKSLVSGDIAHCG